MGLISDGTTIFDAGALDSGLAKGAMTFIKKLTASSSANLTFVDGAAGVVLDSTYKEYVFTFKNIHPGTANDGTVFQFQVDSASATSFNKAITSTNFYAYHKEADGGTALSYSGSRDLANGTGFQTLTWDSQGTDNDNCLGGSLTLFNPSSTTFVKHFISITNGVNTAGDGTSTPYSVNCYVAGYVNQTAAVNKVQFKYAVGNIDAGDICLYGIA